ncbi:MAG TPA: DUF2330 domain-containing protein [Actinomycetota bacterium]|nr:DUF2330 domain-containing protein [Actinomycetota bacterium]
MRKLTVLAIVALTILTAAPALACGGLVNPNGTVSLLKTSTLVAYVDGVEHYITSFEFNGGGGEFGSIVPLPGVPSDVKRAGDWTLQRLAREVAPPVRDLTAESAALDAAAAPEAEVLLETRIDALDITVLKGGAQEVGTWAKENGFLLTPDTPEVLEFYARRSPIFMAARFDASAARDLGQATGDGTPIHVTIPTPNPWVPLRILGLGSGPDAPIEADVFLLTQTKPALLPAPTSPEEREGIFLDRNERASGSLLRDLASDKGMSWLPTSDMWFSYLRIDERAGDLTHDLAIDASGVGAPSPIAAGLQLPARDLPDGTPAWVWWVVAGAAVAIAVTVARWGPPKGVSR